MSELVWTPVRVRIGDLRPWERNPRRIRPAHAKRLLQSWQEFGQAQTIAIGPNGEVYDGHQRLSALLSAYGPDYEVVALQSSRPLTESERERLTLLLHAGTVGEWDWEALADWDPEVLTSVLDPELVESLSRDVEALTALFSTVEEPQGVEEEPQEPPEPEPDRAEELLERWGVQPGQVWRIPSARGAGEHRIICGDSGDPATVHRLLGGERPTLVFTDPPYGVSIGEKNRLLNKFQRSRRNLTDIEADDLPPDELYARLLPSFRLVREVMAEDCSVFVTAPQGGDLGLTMLLLMRDAGLPVRHILIWVKNAPTFSLGRLDYDYQHEPILFTWGKRHKRYRRGPHTTSVWMVDRPTRSPDHPTMKPVELVENAILNHTDEGDIVYDPFLGSGTTIVAAERQGRLGRGVELEPRYVAVALQRLADMGLQPELQKSQNG